MQKLTDREIITDLLAEYCRCLDEYDVQGLGETFIEDGVMDQGPGRGGPIQGRKAIMEGVKTRQARFQRTCHQLGQSLFKFQGDAASVLTYVTAWHLTWDGDSQTVFLRYSDDVVRVADGSWKIKKRTSFAMGTQGFEGAQWNWVKRHLPEGR